MGGGTASKWLDLALLMFVIAAGVVAMVPLFVEFKTPICSYTEDKTALNSDNAIYVGENVKTGSDLLMSLVILDEYSPWPKSIRINNSPIVDVNKSWLTNKYSNIGEIYSMAGSYQLCGMLDWKIRSITLVDNGGDPYLQYILEEE